MEQLDLILKGGKIANTEEVFDAAVGVRDGKIAWIGAEDVMPPAAEVIDLAGKIVMPGVIDPHIHFQDPGFTQREDFEHGTMAAAAGGVTTVLSHPLDLPPTTTFEALREKEAAYEGKAYVDYGIHIGATADNTGLLDDLWNHSGATAVKMFMCFSVKEFPFVSDDVLYRTLEKIAALHAVAIIHAESEGILKVAEERVRASGRKDGPAYNMTHPKQAEIEAIARAIYYLEMTGAEGVILHVSTAEGLKLIRSAKERGVKVWAESAPHLFQFTEEDMAEKGPYLKFSPVMHDRENQQEMWELMARGYVDYIGSDHSPYTLEEKQRGEADIFLAPNGIPGVETSLAVFLNAVNEGKLTIPQLVKMTSYRTARIYGLAPEKGSLAIGSDADFTVVDLHKEKAITSEELKSKCKWSPYIGVKLKGWPVMTIVRGKVVYRDGKIEGEKGFGRYLKRKK